MLTQSQQLYLDAHRRHPAVKACLTHIRQQVKDPTIRKYWVLRVEFDGINRPYILAMWKGVLLNTYDLPRYLNIRKETMQPIMDAIINRWREQVINEGRSATLKFSNRIEK